MTGIILIIIGLLISGSGILILSNSSKAQPVLPLHVETNPIESVTASSTDESDINSKAGLDFEKYVVLKFNEKYFSIKNWAGDKYVEGRYAETTTQPDLQLELKLKGNVYPLAVECKWRSKPNSDFVQFANDNQLKRYKAFEETSKIPTFIVLGVGGTPSAPEVVYVIPIKRFNKPNQHLENLEPFKRVSDGNFFFDREKRVLM